MNALILLADERERERVRIHYYFAKVPDTGILG